MAVTLEITGIDQLIGNLDKYVAYNAKASSFALNQIAGTASTQTLKEANANWSGLKAKDFKQKVKIQKSKVSDVQYVWRMESIPIPLVQFSSRYLPVRSKKTKRKTRGGAGVRYKLKKNKTRTLGTTSFIKKSKFNKKDTVFTRRESPDGAPITAHSAITPTSMYSGIDGVEKFKDIFFKNFPQRYKDKLREFTK